MDSKLIETLEEIKNILIENNSTLSSAESCTGGLISSFLTDISGASNFIFQNFVTYSNEAKMRFLNVEKQTLEKYGAVSTQTASQMAQGLLNYAQTSIATTGILGPTGGSAQKPIGLCFIGFGLKSNSSIAKNSQKSEKTEEKSEEINAKNSQKSKETEEKPKKEKSEHEIIEVIKYISPLAQTNDRCRIKIDIAQHAIFEFLKFIKKNV